MTPRALLLGFVLAVFVAAFTPVNNQVIQQGGLISTFLPAGVLAVVVLLALVANPLAGRVRPAWMLSLRELAVVVAIGLAACAWPSYGYFRSFIAQVALPAHHQTTRAAWQANHAMAYLPGASPELAAGFVTDWRAVAGWLTAGDAEAASADYRNALWAGLGESARAAAEAEASLSAGQRGALLRGLNRAMRSVVPTRESYASLPGPARRGAARWLPAGDLESAWANDATARLAVNRYRLVAALPDAVRPPPAGGDWVVGGARAEPRVIDPLFGGLDDASGPTGVLAAVPWRAWRGPLMFWGSVTALMALAVVCLAAIVHRQWSRHERLVYPIPRFFETLLHREEGGLVPAVMRDVRFWVPVLLVLLLHSVNGLHAWLPGVPEVPLNLDVSPLRQLFPNASKMRFADQVFNAQLFLSVIAFMVFIQPKTSFSLGIAHLAYMAVGGAMLAAGRRLSGEYIGAGPDNLLRLGAYLGVAVVVIYAGRRFYADVIKRMAGRPSGAPPWAGWAARGMLASVGGVIALLAWAGLDPWLAGACVLLILMMSLILARIVAETGMFFLQPWWMPVGAITAVLGIEAIGPVDYITLALVSTVLVGDPRTLLMPFLANGFKLADEPDRPRTGRVAVTLTAATLLAFVVAGAAMFAVQYGQGLGGADPFATRDLPTMPFDELARRLGELEQRGALGESLGGSWLDRLGRVDPEPGALAWLAVGGALAVGAGLARLRLPWWPIHPVLFLVWGSYPAAMFAVSILLGWAVKLAVVRVGGAKAFKAVTPVMVGVIVGELLATLLWLAVGAAAFLATGETPPTYSPFP